MAVETIREELTTAELARKYNIHPTMISVWKRTAIENMAFMEIIDRQFLKHPGTARGRWPVICNGTGTNADAIACDG